MPLNSVNYVRPAATQTNNEAIVLTGAIADDATNGRFIVDITATVNAATRLIKKVVITPEYSGVNVRLDIKEYHFAGSGTYTNATTPAISTATNAAAPFNAKTAYLDLDALYTAAGDARA